MTSKRCLFLFDTNKLPLSPQTQLPTLPRVEFSPVQSWNSGKIQWKAAIHLVASWFCAFSIMIMHSLDTGVFLAFLWGINQLQHHKPNHWSWCSFIAGVRWTISSLSEAPTKASDYTSQGLQYLKDLTKWTWTLQLGISKYFWVLHLRMDIILQKL